MLAIRLGPAAPPRDVRHELRDDLLAITDETEATPQHARRDRWQPDVDQRIPEGVQAIGTIGIPDNLARDIGDR